MSNLSRRTKIIIAFVAVVLAGYGVAVFWANKSEAIPADFTDARMQGAIIAQNIVNTSKQSTDDLAEINQYDNEGNYTQALKLTQNLLAQSEALRDQAVQLSGQIGEMTKALSGVKSVDARQAALESIASRLALINQLINYSGDLARLQGVLQARFSGAGQSRGAVQGLVNQLNTDVNAINNFNAQATQSMDRFDQIVKS